MKRPATGRSAHKRARGISLIIVLASLVFLSALVVAFLVQMGTELKSSKTYAEGAFARILSQSATNIVMAEVRDATRGEDGGGNPLAWASQPGMIRTYDNAGNPHQHFKLYSDADMTGSGAFDAAAAAGQLANWFSKKAIYTDLNEPVAVNGLDQYPIIDGNDLKSVSGIPAGAKGYDADDNNAADIAGFYVDKAPVASGLSSNPVPLPTKWLYVLANGRIVAPTGDGNTATVPGAENSPIVGRVAFWTDDESCKINVNVASEGTYTDVPRVFSTADISLAKNQPVNGEFQRYPGHPAMTSLSTVFSKLTPEEITGLVPRVMWGGSKGGTVSTWTSQPITPDADRLYATTDELMFRPAIGTNERRELNDQDAADADLLKRSRFFLTATSKAPDVNLFNKPRVAIWPLHVLDDPAYRTAYDRLIAFCSTLRNDLTVPHRYYFQRQDPNSSADDLPATSTAFGLGRNRALITYLRFLMNSNIPGFGGNFGGKYGQDTDQILTEIFDYVRSTNLRDSLIGDETKRYTTKINSFNSGIGQVVPIKDGDTRGFGRFRTVQGASLLFIANVDGDDPSSQVSSNGSPLPDAAKVPAGHVRVQAIFLVQLFDPSVGSVYNYPNFRWRVEGLSGFKWNLVSMGFPAPATRTQASYAQDNSFFGDQLGLRQLATSVLVSGTIDLPKSDRFSFDGGDVKIILYDPSGEETQTATLRFPGGQFPVPKLAPKEVYNYTWDKKLNSWDPGPYNLRFFTFSGLSTRDNPATPQNEAISSKGGRLAAPSGMNAGAWFLDEDVVRSVIVKSGDIRLVAAQSVTAPPDDSRYPYAPLNEANWTSDVGIRGMHTFFTGNGEPYYGAALGRLVSGLGYDGYSAYCTLNRLKYPPAIEQGGPVSFTAAADFPHNGVAVGKHDGFVTGDIRGDWDNAPLTLRDGPFINKPDEGDMGVSSGDTPYSWKGRDGIKPLTATLFTPNRQIPSAVVFGSLPTGVKANRPWQTLLFRPDPSGKHPGSKNRSGDGSSAPNTPTDHLLLELFNMPVVEPYPISEPLATAGKINMNYQIVPFTYINRDTGLRAILKSEKVIAIPDSEAGRYKLAYSSSQANVRFEVNADETLKGFQERFAGKDIFRSASEICELPIVPVDNGVSTDNYTTMKSGDTYWNTRRLTGDNSRERPYATIYPRLTTKSNTYTIYVRAQSLKKSKNTPAGEWVEGRDQVTGEYRGSQTIERYFDPNDEGIKDYANTTESTPLSESYKFRVLNTKQFAP